MLAKCAHGELVHVSLFVVESGTHDTFELHRVERRSFFEDQRVRAYVHRLERNGFAKIRAPALDGLSWQRKDEIERNVVEYFTRASNARSSLIGSVDTTEELQLVI